MKHAMIIIAILILCSSSAIAQHSNDARGGGATINTNSKMAYHNGPVMYGAAHVYFIWYGCWSETCGNAGSPTTVQLVSDFASTIGGTPYFQMNALYTGGAGGGPTGAAFFSGSVFDHTYSHGFDLTETQIEDIVREQIETNGVPQDPGGIYVVMASADIAARETGFCAPEGNTPPLHGLSMAFGSQMKYAFVGNPARCPTVEAPQFITANGVRLPTPNNDFAADSMITTLAHVLNTTVSNPHGSAWYDRYGLENADKCMNTFGTTFTSANGARANVRWGGRDYLIAQNWINDKRQKCGMQLYQF